MYKFISKEYEITKTPLTFEQAKSKLDANNRIEAVIEIDLYELLTSEDIEDICGLAEETILEEGPLWNLVEISFKIIGCSDDNTLLLLVSGEVEFASN